MKTLGLVTALFILTMSDVVGETPAIFTQVDAQQKFDTAVSDADHAVITHQWFPWNPIPREDMRQVRVCDISSDEELRALSKHVRLIVPPPKKTVVDGKEVLSSIVPGHIDSPGCFAIALKKGEKELLKFRIYDGRRARYIGSYALLKDSVIEVEEDALAPLYASLNEMLQKKLANKPPEATSPAVTPAAVQPSRLP